MALRLNGSTSGYVEIDAPAVAGSNTLTLPNGNGTSGQYLQTDGSGGLSWQTGLAQGSVITAGTAVASTSGTAIDFTGIPSWVKRITVMFSGMSTTGVDNIQIQIGTSAGIQTTGYDSVGVYNGAGTHYTTGFSYRQDSGGAATGTQSGQMIISQLRASDGTWTASGLLGWSANPWMGAVGSKTLSGTLDRVRLTTSGGTNTFDAGVVNILYEG